MSLLSFEIVCSPLKLPVFISLVETISSTDLGGGNFGLVFSLSR